MKEYVVTVDIARKRDFVVFLVLKDCPEVVKGDRQLKALDRVIHFYTVSFIDMFIGQRYSDIVDRAGVIMGHSDLVNNADLLIDGDGIGDVVLEQMQDAGLYPIPIISHGGDSVNYKYDEIGKVFGNAPGKLQGARTLKSINVPKKDLVAASQAVLQQRRLRIYNGKYRDNLVKQLEAFKRTVNKRTGNEILEAGKESDHDDIVACLNMGLWWFINRKDADEIPERELVGNDSVGYEPLDYM